MPCLEPLWPQRVRDANDQALSEVYYMCVSRGNVLRDRAGARASKQRRFALPDIIVLRRLGWSPNTRFPHRAAAATVHAGAGGSVCLSI